MSEIVEAKIAPKLQNICSFSEGTRKQVAFFLCQVVSMQYEDGATVTFSMVAFTEKVCARQIRVFGTRGEITCDMDEMRVRQVDFMDGQGCKC